MNSDASMLFLDTSLQIERLIGPYNRQVVIEQRLAACQAKCVTCHYVLMEFQRSVCSDYVYVHNQALRHSNWEATAQALRSGLLAYRPRALGRCMQILTQTMVASRLERDHGLDLLAAQITRELFARYWRHVDPLADPIHCDLVATGIARQPDGAFVVADSCRKETAACHLPEFLTDHRDELRTVTDYLASHPNAVKEQSRVEGLLAAVLADPRAALGQAACWPLGDVIIALQTPTDTAIWTLDPDFEPLAEALGLQLLRAE